MVSKDDRLDGKQARVSGGGPAPFTAVAFASNDEINHRMSFFEVPEATIDTNRSRHARVQHIAFAYEALDDLLGTYVRLKQLGMIPMWAADQSFQTAIYYEDPDKNILELNVDNFTNVWAVTEQLKGSAAPIARVRRSGETRRSTQGRRVAVGNPSARLRFAGGFPPPEKYDLGKTY